MRLCDVWWKTISVLHARHTILHHDLPNGGCDVDELKGTRRGERKGDERFAQITQHHLLIHTRSERPATMVNKQRTLLVKDA